MYRLTGPMQTAFAYEPNSFIDVHGRYFGAQLADGKISAIGSAR